MITFTVHYAARILLHFNTWQYIDEIAPFGEFAGGFRDSLSLEAARFGVSSGMRACIFFGEGGVVLPTYLCMCVVRVSLCTRELLCRDRASIGVCVCLCLCLCVCVCVSVVVSLSLTLSVFVSVGNESKLDLMQIKGHCCCI